jgi:outer membrane protein TolC
VRRALLALALVGVRVRVRGRTRLRATRARGCRPPSRAPTRPCSGPGDVEAAWWESFGDERLDRLVHEAIVQNYDVRIALANLNEARAARLETKLALLPIVPGDGGLPAVRLSEIDAGGPRAPSTSSTRASTRRGSSTSGAASGAPSRRRATTSARGRRRCATSS